MHRVTTPDKTLAAKCAVDTDLTCHDLLQQLDLRGPRGELCTLPGSRGALLVPYEKLPKKPLRLELIPSLFISVFSNHGKAEELGIH